MKRWKLKSVVAIANLLTEGTSDIGQQLHNKTLNFQCLESLTKAIWFKKRYNKGL